MSDLNSGEVKRDPEGERVAHLIISTAIEAKEREATRALGFEPCPGEHAEELLPCRSCGAAL